MAVSPLVRNGAALWSMRVPGSRWLANPVRDFRPPNAICVCGDSMYLYAIDASLLGPYAWIFAGAGMLFGIVASMWSKLKGFA